MYGSQQSTGSTQPGAIINVRLPPNTSRIETADSSAKKPFNGLSVAITENLRKSINQLYDEIGHPEAGSTTARYYIASWAIKVLNKSQMEEQHLNLFCRENVKITENEKSESFKEVFKEKAPEIKSNINTFLTDTYQEIGKLSGCSTTRLAIACSLIKILNEDQDPACQLALSIGFDNTIIYKETSSFTAAKRTVQTTLPCPEVNRDQNDARPINALGKTISEDDSNVQSISAGADMAKVEKRSSDGHISGKAEITSGGGSTVRSHVVDTKQNTSAHSVEDEEGYGSMEQNTNIPDGIRKIDGTN